MEVFILVIINVLLVKWTTGYMLRLWCLKRLSTIFQVHGISFISGGNQSTRRKPPTCKSLTNFIACCCIEYTSSWAGFELTTLVVICTDYKGSCKPNYYTITTTTTSKWTTELTFNIWLTYIKLSIFIKDKYHISCRYTISW
jgi:hypothetical protein